MSDVNEKNIADLYNSRLNAGLPDHKVVGWGSKESQDLRFEMLSQIGCLNDASVLDVGCGLGAFCEFLGNNDSNLSYFHGVDISEKLIIEANQRFKDQPNIKFEWKNILKSPLEIEYDYAFMSGALNLKMKDNYSYAEEMLSAMFGPSRKGIACNFLSSYADYYADKDFHYEPEKIFSYAKTLGTRVTLKHDYLLYEFTIFIYKE
jgi:SAM-dependent methyltransferase